MEEKPKEEGPHEAMKRAVQLEKELEDLLRRFRELIAKLEDHLRQSRGK